MAIGLAVLILIVLGALYLIYGRGGTTANQNQPTISEKGNQPSTKDTLPPGFSTVKIFLVSLNDNGQTGKKIGCGDSVMGVEKVIGPTPDKITAALNELFAIKDQNYGEYYNALYQSNLKVESATVKNGKATVKLSGKYLLGGTCDDPRFQSQIEETVLQFPEATDVEVFINGKSLEKIVSGKG